ncbi:MAG: AlpA family phage regulatory protein, partial [Azoarcus sp.]|nr:AlpA family phage regulatory protein [Azoarcus sp.]
TIAKYQHRLQKITMMNGCNRPARVRGILGVSPATLRRWVEKEQFPRPIRLSKRVSVWRAEDVQAWMLDRSAKSA